jgi:hypothetical protein
MIDQDLKRIARRLGGALKASGHKLPHGVLLHALAACTGHVNWHVLAAGNRGAQAAALTAADLAYIHDLIASEDAFDLESRHLPDDSMPEGLLQRLIGVPTTEATPKPRVLLTQSAPSHWEDDDRFPVSDWRYEVANDDTRLGYQEWVEHQREAESPSSYTNPTPVSLATDRIAAALKAARSELPATVHYDTAVSRCALHLANTLAETVADFDVEQFFAAAGVES